MAEEKNSSMICLGHISDAHGIHGEVLIKAYTEAWEDIAAYGPLPALLQRRLPAIHHQRNQRRQKRRHRQTQKTSATATKPKP